MTDTEELARAMAAAHGLDWDGKYKATEYANHGYWLKSAEAILPIITHREEAARAAGAAEMQERCAGVAEQLDARWWEANACTQQRVTKAIRSLT